MQGFCSEAAEVHDRRGWPCKPCTATTLFIGVSSANGKITQQHLLEVYSGQFVRLMHHLQPLEVGLSHLACNVGSKVGKRSCDIESKGLFQQTQMPIRDVRP